VADPAPEVHQAEPVQAQAQHQAPEPAELVHQAPWPGSVNPAGSPVPDVLTGAHVRRLMRAHGVTIERVAVSLGVTRARVQQVRERGLSGLPYVLDWLQGITGRAPALARGVWWHDQGRPPGLPGPEPAELVTAAPGGPPCGSDPPMASPATDYPINPHGFSVALTQRFRPIQARAMRTRHADIRTRRAPMRTRWQPLQPVQAGARLPCPGLAGRPGGRAGGLAPRGQAPPWVSRPVRHPPPGVAASADRLQPSPVFCIQPFRSSPHDQHRQAFHRSPARPCP
jgi:pyruvate/2-oxoglutarate dehydrogenase complex dihydrolipoamide acyltransferase (E2) component